MIAASMMPEGTESNRTLEFLAWLEVNKKRLAIGGAVIAVVASVVATQQWLSRERERVANAALLQLELPGQTGVPDSEPSASEFQKLATEHAGTRAAARAQLLAAGALFKGENYEEARKEFETAEGVLDDESLIAVASFGVAASLDALGRAEEAFQAYQDVTLRHATAAVATQAQLAIAGLHQQKGEWVQALQLYNQLTNAVTSAWMQEAVVRREALLQQHPELAPTNQVPATDLSEGLSMPATTNVVETPNP